MSEVMYMRWKRTTCVLLAAAVWFGSVGTATATISNIQSQKAQNEKELKNIQSQISSLENQRSALNMR